MVALALETIGAVVMVWSVLFISVEIAIAIWKLNKESNEQEN
jgi:hypothetical protein